MRVGFKRLRALYVYQILAESDAKMSRNDIYKKLKQEYGIEDRPKTIGALLSELVDAELIKGEGFVERVSKKNKDDEYDNSFYSKYYVDKLFSDDELLWLIDNTIFSKQISLTKSKTIVKKLLKLGGKNISKKVGSVEGMLQFYHTPNEEVSKSIEILSDAIHKNKTISFYLAEYQLDKTLKIATDELLVKPVRMVPCNGYYYLIAFVPDTDNLQHYRIDKIKNLKVSEEFIDYDVINSKLYIDEYLASHSLMQSGSAVNVRIKIPEDQIGIVIDQFGNKFRVFEVADGQVAVSFTSNESDLYLWALEHGDMVEVLEPQSVRNKIRNAARSMAKSYLKSDEDQYFDAIKYAKDNDAFACIDIDLSNKTEWHYLTNLKTLEIENNGITDISFISEYKKLCYLTIINDKVKDVSVIKELPLLSNFHLENTDVEDISDLSKCNELFILKLINNKFKDFSILYEIKKLRFLSIDYKAAEKIDIQKLVNMHDPIEIEVIYPNKRKNYYSPSLESDSE